MRDRLLLRIAVMAAALCVMSGCAAQNTVGSTSTTASPPPAPLFSSMLADLQNPVDVLIVGDGTGKSLGGWVYLTAQALAQQFGRPVDIRDWDFESGVGYIDPPVHVADGSGQPITVWNASVSRNVAYLAQSLPGMTPPGDVDLVLVNNGMDMGPDTLAQESIPMMRTLTADYPAAPVVAVLQPAPTEPGAVRDRLRGNTHDLDISCRKNNFQTIDIAKAFDGVAGLYDGPDSYPNDVGQRVWSETVIEAVNSTVTTRAG